MLQHQSVSTASSSSQNNLKINKTKLEVSPAAATFLDTAINFAEEATEEDESGRLDSAISKYENAVSQFSLALKNETNSEIKAMIKDRLVKYTTRCEQLKQFQKSGVPFSKPIPMGLKPGEKFRPHEGKKKSTGGIFGKKEKKTWDKF